MKNSNIKNKSIGKKISSLTVSISLVSLIIIGVVSISGLWIVRSNNVKTAVHLREMAIEDFQKALEEVVTEGLLYLVNTNANLCDSIIESWDIKSPDFISRDDALPALRKILLTIRLRESGGVFLLDDKSEIIISENIEHYLNGVEYSHNENFKTMIQKMMQGETGIEKLEINGKELIFVFTALNAAPWSLVTVFTVEEIVAPALKSRDRIIDMKRDADKHTKIIIVIFIFIYLMMIIFAVIFISYAAKKFTNTLVNPIKILKEGVQQFSNGNLDYDIVLKTGDEIEDLGICANKMADDLKNYIINIQKITGEKERIKAELSVAAAIQVNLLPRIFPAFPERREFDIYACMQSAKEAAGDFYDFFLIDNNTLAVVIADVSDKGMPAAMFMVIAKTLIKNNIQQGKSPGEVFKTVNNMLYENNDSNMFVTAFLGYLDISSGIFTYVNAGHNPPLIRRLGGSYEIMNVKPGFILAGIADIDYRQDEIVLNTGDEIFMYTDGITEAVKYDANNKKIFFGENRLLEAADKYQNIPLKEFTESIKLEIDKFSEGAEQADDITMVSLRYKGKKKELVLDAKLENLPHVFAFIEKALVENTCTHEDINRIKIAAEEIFVNIANHAYPKDNTIGTAVIRIWTEQGNLLTIEFEDSGIAFNPLEKDDPDISSPSKEREPGGLGIYLAKKYMDLMEYAYRNGKNILTVKIAI